MKRKLIIRLCLPLVLFLTSIAFWSVAQKLPNVQPSALYAPANIKIDGNATEWNNQFRAYNKATNIFYTIANDDHTLYLAIQATEQNIIYKIINGGITLTINNTGKKNTINKITVSYPLFGIKNLPIINLRDKPVPAKNSSDNMTARIDSFKKELNVQLEKNSKEIKISGISSIADPSISVYNEYGIRAGEQFDNQLAYTYELALPIKYLKSAGIDPTHIHYNIKISGRLSALPMNKQPLLIVASPQDKGALYDTDFGGEYTLAKKQ